MIRRTLFTAWFCTAAPAAAQQPPRVEILKEFPDLSAFLASLPVVEETRLDSRNAVWLAAMPLSCMSHPHNPPAPVPYLWEASFTPVANHETTRAFYGCSDWHSAVNSAWTLVKLMKLVPDLSTAPVIRQKLNDHFGASNVGGEVEYFRGQTTFELPYGYAWLLRLQGEMRSWQDTTAQRWAGNMQPLADLMSGRMITYLNQLQQPNRSGLHPNTAMAMDNMLDYAMAYDTALEKAIRTTATRMFANDRNCNTAVEPGSSDFASPCLMEASIMGRLMPRAEYLTWLDAFLPPLHSKEFRPLTQPLGPEFVENPTAIAARSHIIGLAFVRAKSMGEIANMLPAGDPRIPVLRRLAAMQVAKGLQVIGAVGYDGSHYYATWATTYLMTTR